MIQDIYPHRFNNDFVPNLIVGNDDFILHFNDNKVLLKTVNGKLQIPKTSDFSSFVEGKEGVFLFTFNETPCFLVDQVKPKADANLEFMEISFFRTTDQLEVAWISMVGYHLYNWYTQNQFCGKCGSKTAHKSDERALVCTNCHLVIYPRISPAIIVAVVNHDQILLARGANFTGGWYALIAGFTDVGETLEETVIREVKEEVGIDVKNIRYYYSQPWAYSGSMMVGFVAEADPDQTIKIDEKEIAEAAWFKRGDLPEYPLKLSIAGDMISKFEKGEL